MIYKIHLLFSCRSIKVFKISNHFGILDDKMDVRIIVFRYNQPFPHIDLNLNISESMYSICIQVISDMISHKLLDRCKKI